MLNIISKGYIDILRLFYVRKERLHLRAIAKKVNLNENSAFRFLNMLEKDSFLSSEKIGNMKLFSIKPSKKLFSVFSFFDVERFENLPSIRKNAIQIFLNDLSSPPVFVILFGSTAKGSFRKNSDVDVLIITNTIIDTNLAQKNANAQTALELNIFQITYSDFITELKMKEDLVIQSALESGFPVTNHIMFYEVLHNSKI